MGPIAAAFVALYATIEVGKNVLTRFTPSDFGKGVIESSNKIEESLTRIANKAAIARGEISQITPPKRQSSGWIDDLQVKSDEFFSGAASKVGIKWQNTNTAAEDQTKKDIEATQKAGETAKKLATQFDKESLVNSLNQTKQRDEDLKRLGYKKQALQGALTPDKQAIEKVDVEIAAKTGDRKKAAETFSDRYGAVSSALKNYQEQLAKVDTLEVDDSVKEQLKKPLQESVTALKTAKEEMDGLQKSVGTVVDPTQKLLSAFEGINTALEETRRKADAAFAQRTLKINTDQLTGFNNDIDAGGKANVAKAEAERDRLSAQVSGSQTAISKTKEQLSDPMVQDMLKSVTTTSGASITPDSSIAQIEDAKKRLSDKDSGKKDVLDQLKAYREQRDKLPELQGQLAGSKLQVKEAGQQLVLTQLGRQTADDESKVKRTETDRNAKLRSQQSAVNVKRSKNLFYSDADAGIAEADLGIRQAESQRTSATTREGNVGASLRRIKESFDAGKISKEEYVRQERELGDQLVEARSKSAEAEAQIEEARAKKFEAVNRRRIEKVQELNADEESILKRRETLANAGFSAKQASLSMAKARTRFTVRLMQESLKLGWAFNVLPANSSLQAIALTW
jgi:chromosome segregation ATPase